MIDLNLDTVVIHRGSHANAEQGHCVMEVVSMLAAEPWTDAPQCVCPTIRALATRVNDAFGADDEGRTAAFRPLIRKMMGTRGSRALMMRRVCAAADAAVHMFAPLALDAAKQSALADKLRGAPTITDADSARRARDVARQVRASATASAASAASAAYASAASAAYASSASAAYAAADYASAARSSRIQALREALAHGIALLERLCEMKESA